MARIVGSLLPDAAAAATQVEQMLAASAPRALREAAYERTQGVRAAFGAVGTHGGSLRSDGCVAALVDGTFYQVDGDPDGSTDADVLIALFRRHGFVDALRMINGDFAVALWDGARETLWLGRDRFGVRPLYFAETPSGFSFASRPRALLAGGIPAVPDPAFVARFAGLHYRTFDNQTDGSPYKGISQLPAATALEVRRDGVPRRTVWWGLADEPDLGIAEGELAVRYRDLLMDAVRIRLRRADRPAFTLSGGMDSSSVLCCAVRLRGQQHAYSAVYDDPTYDESHEIRPILDGNVEQWHTVAAGRADPFALVPRMVEANDEPVATATWLSHYLLCEQASKDGFGTLFGGLGGDELNAGEYEYFLFFFADLRVAGEDALLEQEIASWAKHHDHPIFRKSRAVVEDALGRIVDLSTPGRCLPDQHRQRRYLAALRSEYLDLRRWQPVMDHPFRSYLKNRTYQDIFRETAPCCLRAADRQTEAFGLAVAWPFFDHRLAELMFRVSGTQKIKGGVTKHLLREAMRDVVPEETRTRVKKTGWNAPAHLWFSGKGADQVADLIHSRCFRERGIYDVSVVELLLAEHQDIVTTGRPAENHMMFFWQLVNLELWLQSLRDHG